MVLTSDENIKEYYEKGIYYYQGLPDDLDSLSKYEPIKNIITPPLDDEQSITLLRALFVKRYCLFHSTGLGKTFISAAWMKAIKNSKPNAKFLMIVKLDQQMQTPKKIINISGLKSKFYDAKDSSVLTRSAIDNNDIIMITHNSLSSPSHMERINRYLDMFTGIVVDESHLLSNIEEASSAYTLYCMSHRVEYFLSLTATPITSDVEQLARVLKITAPMFVDNFKKLGSILKSYGFTAIPKQLLDLFSIRDRINNRVGYAIWVEPMVNQIDAKGQDLFIKTKGPGSINQAEKLIEIINSHSPEKGIVYVNHSEVYKFILPYLLEKGIRVNFINGKVTSREKRNDIINDFKNGEYDVILTNIKESLDMDSDYVVFYEFTKHVKQFIGRAERGLNPKKMPIYFMFTKDTDEFDYFIRNVYEISQDAQDLLGMDFREILELKDM